MIRLRVPRKTLEGFDYAARPEAKLEVSQTQRIEAMREQRARARVNAARREQPGRSRPFAARRRAGR